LLIKPSNRTHNSNKLKCLSNGAREGDLRPCMCHLHKPPYNFYRRLFKALIDFKEYYFIEFF
jgi:hypothetical protein